uniref:Histidine--tRNA ligase, chloroplastic n=1 Tax=Polysiphonia infestans TaxID=2006978 RepID=A0A1Z1MEF8_9FLOR|nr:Histidine-tRNA ligase [Polysiphonia infestans]ARW64457.1 Histidine-tRNA ligase [Polysiphonia infestans]
MQPIRGTKDILPNEIEIWQAIYSIAQNTLKNYNYSEIRTPIIENTNLFERGVGNFTDIVNREMYTFTDRGNRSITLRPEGTSSIARAVLSNKIHLNNKINRLWYLGPMFRYERPQKGRQRQFHQLGIECVGTEKSIADAEVIKIAYEILKKLNCEQNCHLEINSIGNMEERELYKQGLTKYLKKYESELDKNSQKRICDNPLRILDSKNEKTQQIIREAPVLKNYLGELSIKHFNEVCEHLNCLDIKYEINNYLVRGLDYYNYTAFEIKTNEKNNQNTICGGGRYDYLTKQLGGPEIPAVGWAIGIERLISITKDQLKTRIENKAIYIATEDLETKNIIWDIIHILEKYKLKFDLDFTNNSISKKVKKANQVGTKICIVVSQHDLNDDYLVIRWLNTGKQQKVSLLNLEEYIKYIKNFF